MHENATDSYATTLLILRVKIAGAFIDDEQENEITEANCSSLPWHLLLGHVHALSKYAVDLS